MNTEKRHLNFHVDRKHLLCFSSNCRLIRFFGCIPQGILSNNRKKTEEKIVIFQLLKMNESRFSHSNGAYRKFSLSFAFCCALDDMYSNDAMRE